MYVRNAWYVACTLDEIADRAARPDDLRRPHGLVPRRRRRRLRARGLLPASRRAALARQRARRRPHRLRLPRPGDGRRRPLRRMPGQRVRPTIKSYPALERYGFVWVWPGDEERRRPGASCTRCPGPKAPSGPTAAACTTSSATTG